MNHAVPASELHGAAIALAVESRIGEQSIAGRTRARREARR